MEKGRKNMSEEKAKKYLEVIAHYPAAKEPFEQKHASRSETLGTVKSAAIKAFRPGPSLPGLMRTLQRPSPRNTLMDRCLQGPTLENISARAPFDASSN